jgi:hypothetical protein
MPRRLSGHLLGAACKAASIRKGESLANFLHGVADRRHKMHVGAARRAARALLSPNVRMPTLTWVNSVRCWTKS